MTNHILEHLRSKFTTATVNDLAQTLNENPASTKTAVDGLLPAVTAGVINRSNQSDGLTLIHNLLNNAKFDSEPIGQLVETPEDRRKAAESGNEFMTRLHGGQVDQLAQETAAYSGVKQASASTLIGLIASVLMGYLHTRIRAGSLNETQLATLLRDETDGIRAGVPAALATAVAWLPTITQTRVTTTSVPVTPVVPVTPAAPVTSTVRTEDNDNKGSGWWRWLLLALGLIGLFLLLTRMSNRDETESATVREETVVSADTTETVASDTVGNASNAAAEGPEVRVGVDLPGGRKLNVVENSFNFQLATFLAAKGSQTPKVFTFDNLTFETNSARITTEARPNVDDLIQIMQAYPSMNIRIEGNTDSTGPESLNDPLSADRAEAVKAELVKAGIDSGRVATRERGESKPVATNETEAGREKNRRIDVIVTKL